MGTIRLTDYHPMTTAPPAPAPDPPREDAVEAELARGVGFACVEVRVVGARVERRVDARVVVAEEAEKEA